MNHSFSNSSVAIYFRDILKLDDNDTKIIDYRLVSGTKVVLTILTKFLIFFNGVPMMELGLGMVKF